MLAPKGCLAAAEVAFFGPAFLIGVYVVFRHGFSRQMGWLYIVVLSILRIVGAAATLDMDITGNYSNSLLGTAAITSAVGTAPLLLALLGFLERINQGMEHKGISLMIFRPMHLLSFAALVIAIIGGTDEMDSSASSMKTGRELMESASIIFLALYLGLAGITLFNAMNIRWVISHEMHLMRACDIALPFLLVRIAYTIAVAFCGVGGTFQFRNVEVFAQAFMQFLMEAIVVCLFIAAGLMTPKMEKCEALAGSRDVESQKVEMLSGPTQQSGPRYQQERPRFQQPRKIGDYRPSRLIKNALCGRQ